MVVLKEAAESTWIEGAAGHKLQQIGCGRAPRQPHQGFHGLMPKQPVVIL